MYSVQLLSFLGLFAAFFGLSQAGLPGRLYQGQPVDNLRQFPHHVYITIADSMQKCGGSIINEHWILTSASCVKHAVRLDLNFRKKHEYDTRADYFTISVNREQIFIYPTNYDDIALIRVPITLVFSESLAPVNISRLPIEALRGRFTVMPGFTDNYFGTTVDDWTTPTTTTVDFNNCHQGVEICTTTVALPTTTTTTTCAPMTTTRTPMTTTTPCSAGIECHLPPTDSPATFHPSHDQDRRTDNLKYGMFNVLENRVCKTVYGSAFDEYTQLCIDRWGDNPNRPCESDYGSGLIVGWPSKSELVGLFSMYSTGCESRKPSIFTFTGKYMGWIESLIRG